MKEAFFIASAILSDQKMTMVSFSGFQVGHGNYVHGVFKLALF